MATSTTYSIPEVGKKKGNYQHIVRRREKDREEKNYRACPKGAAVQMFLFNSCTIVHKRAYPGHVDLSH